MLTALRITPCAVLIGLLSAHLVPVAAYGQRAGQAQSQERESKVYRIQRADVEEIADVLRHLEFQSIAIDRKTQSIIVHAEAATHEKVAKLIDALDVPGSVESDDASFIDVEHRDAEQMADLLKSVLDVRRARIAYDQSNKVVIVKGAAAIVAEAREVIKRLDAPQRALTLTFYFVQGTIGQGAVVEAPGLPRELQKVAPTLARSGFENMSLLAPMTTTIQEAETFQLSGHLDQSRGVSLGFEVYGEVHQAATDDQARVSIQAEISQGRGDSARSMFRVDSTLTVKIGDFVVLAAAPSTNGDHDALALIVRAD